MCGIKRKSSIDFYLDNIDVKVYPQCCPGGSTERCKNETLFIILIQRNSRYFHARKQGRCFKMFN